MGKTNEKEAEEGKLGTADEEEGEDEERDEEEGEDEDGKHRIMKWIWEVRDEAQREKCGWQQSQQRREKRTVKGQ